jgi:PAS domain S-box-containing protein
MDVLRACGVLDTPPDADLDGLTAVAAALAGTPIALISLVDAERQWFKAKVGLGASETPRSISFCGHAILGDVPFVVRDATRDPRFADNPLVCGAPNVVFYVGIPLRVGPSRMPVGTLCVIDHTPHELPEATLGHLCAVARQVELALELRRRERDLQQRIVDRRMREDEVRTLIDTMDAGIVVQERGGTIVSCNPSACRILGLSADQLAGRTSMDPRWRAITAEGATFPGEGHPAMVSFRTGKPVTNIVMGIRMEGEEQRWVLINAQPLGLEADGAPERVVCSFLDITALRREETKRHRAEERAEKFFTISLDLFCLTSFDGKFLRVNPAWRDVLGWTEQELTSLAQLELVHPEDRERTIAEIARLASGASSVAFETRFRKRDGSYRHLAWTCAGVPSHGCIMAVARDVTDQRAHEAELVRARHAAESAHRAKSEFLATMSHEIRTPMNGVLGMTEVLLGTPLQDEQRSMLFAIKDSGTALLQILNDVLDWSRIEAGRLPLEIGPVDTCKVARDVTIVLGAQAQAKSLALRVETSGEAALDSLGDPGRVRQVLMNLVGNAIKFTERGQVTVRVERVSSSDGGPEGACQISVTDSGIGMSEEAVGRLFERFTQVDSSNARRATGTGLGLAISRQLVLAMSGTISVTSKPEQGTTFTVRLPLAPPRPKEAAMAPLPPERTDGTQLRILVAEDNPVNQRVARALLQREGHEVHVVANGNGAVSAYQEGGWDLVLMDMQMPEMDGIQATEVIREIERCSKKPRVRIVALTASVMPEQRQACFAAGMDDILGKPFTIEALRRVLQQAA